MFNDIISNIEEQVKHCRKLLGIFQDERKLYLEKGSIGQQEICEILGRKKMLVEAFENQRQAMLSIEEENRAAAIPENIKDKRKTLVRELAGLLEQLIVIDQENEKMLRNILCSGGAPAQAQPKQAAMPLRQRPALQRQLPFVPFAEQAKPLIPRETPKLQPMQSAPVRPTPAQQTVRTTAPAATTPLQSSVPKSNIRQYMEAGKLLQLSSKYA